MDEKYNIDWDYFADAGIPKENMTDFLTFAMRDEKVLRYMKAKNIGGLTISLDDNINAYLDIISQKK